MPAKSTFAAILLTVAAITAMVLPFLSATVLTLGLGGVAFAAGIGQLLRLGESDGTAA